MKIVMLMTENLMANITWWWWWWWWWWCYVSLHSKAGG